MVSSWHARKEDLIFCLLSSSVSHPSCLLLPWLSLCCCFSVLGVFWSVPRQLFYPFLLLSRKRVQWDDRGFPLWGCLVVPDLTLPGSRSPETEGEERGRDCGCKWAPAAQVCLHSKVKLIWTDAIILLLLEVIFCLISLWWKTTGLWAGNPHCSTSGYWQGRDEDSLQQIYLMSCIGHQVCTNSSCLTFAKVCSSATSRAVQWPVFALTR